MQLAVGLLLLLGLALVPSATAAARAVQVEVRTATGAALGRVPAIQDERSTAIALDDVAQLVEGALRRFPDGDRLVLIARGKTLEVRRDRAEVRVAGRRVALSAPVRVRQGRWFAPADFLARALPHLLGSAVQAAVVPAAPAAVARAATPVPVQPVVAPASPPPRPPAIPSIQRPAPATAEPARPAQPAEESDDPAPAAPIRTRGAEVRYRSYPGYTRVVVEGAAAFEPRLVESRDALIVPLTGLPSPLPRASRQVRDGLVEAIELGPSRGTPALRVSFERPPTGRKVYRLKDPPRLVLDFYRGAPAAPAPGPRPEPVALRSIVLDPGHGGHDPGATGPRGLQEKDLTLDIARRLAVVLQEELAVKVTLTRTRDVFVPLRERTTLANRQKADLFVSIHVNAARGASASGTETYFLSSEATDNAARAAAALENKVIELEPGARGGSRDLLRSILWDLAQSEFQQESSRLAESLQDNLERALRQPSRGVKQAPFYVLGGAAMPAVLVEIGFISNAHEEERLQDEGYRDRIARALAAGLAAYKRRYDQKSGPVAAR
jgi:N-acetylmuramoyl-L-alanine amidase